MKVLLPSRVLAPYIEAYYISSNWGQDHPPARFPAISTSYIKFSQASAIVSGQATRPTVTDASFDHGSGLGVKLRPGALSALFGTPAHELTDRVIPLEEVLGRTTNELLEQLAAAPNTTIALQFFEKTFAPFAESRQASKDPIERETPAILRQLSTMQVSKLARKLGYSSRHFQRKLNESVGLSPRLYKRIARFERAIELIRRKHKNINWAAIALACGYADQAHLIRDFREFAGQTPAGYLESLQAG